jgi:hypothetical protein
MAVDEIDVEIHFHAREFSVQTHRELLAVEDDAAIGNETLRRCPRSSPWQPPSNGHDEKTHLSALRSTGQSKTKGAVLVDG